MWTLTTPWVNGKQNQENNANSVCVKVRCTVPLHFLPLRFYSVWLHAFSCFWDTNVRRRTTIKQLIKGLRYTLCIFRHFLQRNNFCDFLFAFFLVYLVHKIKFDEQDNEWMNKANPIWPLNLVNMGAIVIHIWKHFKLKDVTNKDKFTWDYLFCVITLWTNVQKVTVLWRTNCFVQKITVLSRK